MMKKDSLKIGKFILSTLFFAIAGIQAQAQFNLSGEIRPRTEFAHGSKSLVKKGDQVGVFTTQRTRLNINYNDTLNKIKVGLVLQDIRTWGSQSQLVLADGLFSIHQAWVDWGLAKDFSLKAGRQELIYDDHRIFGSVGWAQQARSHDVAVLKYKNKLHLGAAWNQNKPSLRNSIYTIPKSYKTFQYLWYHLGDKDSSDFNASFLVLNNGKPINKLDTAGKITEQSIEFSQTVGGRFIYKASKKLKLSSNLYYQMGLDGDKNSLSAYLVNLDLTYKVTNSFTLRGGFERQSGNDGVKQTAKTNNAFTPFYGTNHKFNGWMDYFYVGNHVGSVGLQDNYIYGTHKLSKKAKFIWAFHNFSSANTIEKAPGVAASSQALGNEIDLVLAKKVNKAVTFKIGYSHLFADKGLELLKGGDKSKIQNWAWVMLVFKPKFI